MAKLSEYRFGRRMYDLDIYDPHYGSCDREAPRRRRIVVNEDIDSDIGFHTLLHEVIHAIDDDLSHSKVDRLAKYMSKFLLDMGYRRK